MFEFVMSKGETWNIRELANIVYHSSSIGNGDYNLLLNLHIMSPHG